jgi:Tfp pilus assembly protein PilX
MRTAEKNPARRGRRREEGSAYIIALVVLAILSIVGLSLAFITQSEMQVGSNERTASRVFYAADSGISAATAAALVSADYRPKTYTFTEPNAVPGLGIKHQVQVSPFYPLLDAPCNLCEINNAGTYNEHSYRKINHGVTATAVRIGGGTTLAQKTLTAMVEVQPWKANLDAYLPINDPAQLAQIKF